MISDGSTSEQLASRSESSTTKPLDDYADRDTAIGPVTIGDD